MVFDPLTKSGQTRTPQTPDENVKLRFNGWAPVPSKEAKAANKAAEASTAPEASK